MVNIEDQIGLDILTLSNWMIFMGKLNCENSRHKTDKSINMKGEQNVFITSFQNVRI
jgi:hypothetical protein